MFYHRHNWLGFATQLIDLSFFVSTFLMAFYSTIIMLTTHFAFNYIYCNILQNICKKLTTIVDKYRRKRKLRIINRLYGIQIQTQYIITQCFHAHAFNLFTIDHINKTIISPSLYIFTLAVLTSSTYLIVFIWFSNLTFFIRLAIFTLWFEIISFFIILSYYFACLNNDIIKSAKPFYNILSILDKNYFTIRKRWKLATYYELLNRSTKPLLIKAGPLGDITKMKVYEVG